MQEITVDTDNSTLSITKISTDDFSNPKALQHMYDSNKEYDFTDYRGQGRGFWPM